MMLNVNLVTAVVGHRSYSVAMFAKHQNIPSPKLGEEIFDHGK